MKIIENNNDNLSIKELEDIKRKARAVVLNKNNEILLAHYAGMYMLPGGKIDDNEEVIDALKRELKEESGITDFDMQASPFLLIKDYIRNYPKRDEISIFNRYTETYFYIVHTESIINKDNMSLTDSEKNKNFSIDFVPINKVSELLKENSTNNPKNKYFVRELEIVLENIPK